MYRYRLWICSLPLLASFFLHMFFCFTHCLSLPPSFPFESSFSQKEQCTYSRQTYNKCCMFYGRHCCMLFVAISVTVLFVFCWKPFTAFLFCLIFFSEEQRKRMYVIVDLFLPPPHLKSPSLYRFPFHTPLWTHCS